MRQENKAIRAAMVRAARKDAGKRMRGRLAKWRHERRARGRWELITTPGSIAVRSHNGTSFPVLGRRPVRGIIRGWSPRSKRRLWLRMASIPWPEVAYIFLTLTYPDDFPHDPEVWKRHLHEFEKAWERRFGPTRAVWVLEFQRRGAPHFHMVLVAPEAHLPIVRRWYAMTWHRIVTGCRGNHESAAELGAGCVPWHYERHMADEHCKAASGAREAISYVMREIGKESQKTLPAFLGEQKDGTPARGAGRWWGVWGFKPDESSTSITKHEYVALRRVALRLGHQVSRREHARRERLRAYKLATGRPWTPRSKPPSRWLSPRSINQGIAIIDRDLRPYVFARAFRGVLTDLRHGKDPDPEAAIARIERSLPRPAFGWA